MAEQRPTPAHPTPHLAAAHRNGVRQRDLPPELDPGSIAVLSGATFMYSDPTGDIPAGSIGGLVHLDTRLLNRWMLTVNGAPLLVLRSGTVDHYSAEFYLANPELPDLPADALTVRRRRYLGEGLHERIEVHYSATEPVRVELRLGVGSDFADLLEIKSGVRERAEAIARRHRADSGRLLFRYEAGDFVAQTEVHGSPAPDRVDGDDFVWVLDLPPGGDWGVDLKVSLPPGMGVVEPVRGDFEDVFRHSAVDPAARWRSVVARFSSDSDLFEQVIEQTLTDLVALRLEAEMNGQRVWPHDNSIAVLGMARYGYREEANRVSLALLEAAKAFSFRLPEAIAGYQRARSTWPVQYPTACSPQAWAAGAPLNFLRGMLGLDAVGGKLVVDPQVPEEIGRIMINGMRAFGRHWDIEAVGSTGYVRLAEP